MKSFLFCSTTAVLVFALATSVWAEPPKDFTNSIGMKFKLIPAGQFMMGSSESAEALAEVYKRIQPSANTKSEYFEREYPQHRVRITKPYYLGVYEVTVGDFRRFVSERQKVKRTARAAGDMTANLGSRRLSTLGGMPVSHRRMNISRRIMMNTRW